MNKDELVIVLEALYSYAEGAKDAAQSGATLNVCTKVQTTIEALVRDLLSNTLEKELK